MKINRKYLRIGLTGIAIVIVGLLCFFLLFRIQAVSAACKEIRKILSPFLYGAVIAYLLTPLCNRMERLFGKVFRRKSGLVSGLSITFTMLLSMTVIGVLFMLVIPQVQNSVIHIADVVPGQLSAANTRLQHFLESQPELLRYWNNAYASLSDQIDHWLKGELLPSVGSLIGDVGSRVAAFFGLLKNLFLGILISVYFLASRRQFATQARMLLYGIFPGRCASLIEEEVHYADRMFNGFLVGKLLDSAIIGVICFVFTALMRFDSAVLISVIVGVTNIIPFFGPIIGAVPCLLLLILQNPLHALYFLIFVIILQQLDGNVIGPRILGNTTGLSSFWVLFAILVFGGLWGIFGMVIGVPLFAVIYDIIRKLTFRGLRSHDREEMIGSYQSAFHPEETPPPAPEPPAPQHPPTAAQETAAPPQEGDAV